MHACTAKICRNHLGIDMQCIHVASKACGKQSLTQLVACQPRRANRRHAHVTTHETVNANHYKAWLAPNRFNVYCSSQISCTRAAANSLANQKEKENPRGATTYTNVETICLGVRKQNPQHKLDASASKTVRTSNANRQTWHHKPHSPYTREVYQHFPRL